MSRIEWLDLNYEVGVDRGVLYLNNCLGIPWNGLISVNQKNSGGEIESYYIDGLKYTSKSSSEVFEALLEAYIYPEEFLDYDGTFKKDNGLLITNQPKEKFSLSYRTKQSESDYKIHLIYNVVASPTTEKDFNTLGGSVDLTNFTWLLSAKPSLVEDHKPAAYFVIDSKEVPELLLFQIENLLYGTNEADPCIPSIEELMFMFRRSDVMLDARYLHNQYLETVDSGTITNEQISTVDGGGP